MAIFTAGMHSVFEDINENVLGKVLEKTLHKIALYIQTAWLFQIQNFHLCSDDSSNGTET